MSFASFMTGAGVHPDDIFELDDNYRTPTGVVHHYEVALKGEIDNITDVFGIKYAILGKFICTLTAIPDTWEGVDYDAWMEFYEKEVDFMKRSKLFDIRV